MQNVKGTSSHPIIYGFDVQKPETTPPATNASNLLSDSKSAEQPKLPFASSKPTFQSLSIRQGRHAQQAQVMREMSPRLTGKMASTSTQPIANLFANRPTGTCAITPDGSSAIARTGNGPLQSFRGFVIRGSGTQSSGKIDTTVLKDLREDCIALTWIEKEEQIPKGAVDLALWYLSKYTDKPNIEVRSIVNEDLSAHLHKNYRMEDVDGNGMRGNTKEIQTIAAQRLTANGWILKSGNLNNP